MVSLSFGKLADANLVTKTNQILASMTGNTNYPTPTPTLPVVQAAATAFSSALTAAADGGRTKTAEKNAARTVLLGLLRNLALFVQQHCHEDLVLLLTSGFDAQKEPQPAGTLPPPQGATLTQSRLSRQLEFRAGSVANANAYEGQVTTDIGKDEWENVGTFTATRFSLDDLKPGTTYWARSRAVGSAGPGAWSDAVSAMAI